MATQAPLQYLRAGWWAEPELASPLHALRGSLLRAEMTARFPGFSPVLVCEGQAWWPSPGFTGEPVAAYGDDRAPGGGRLALDIFVASGAAGANGQKVAQALAEVGTATAAVAPEPSWSWEPEHTNIGPPFGLPEPVLLAARHLPGPLLESRGAYLRVVEGLPKCYVLVEADLLTEDGWHGSADLELALERVLDRATAGGRAGAGRAEVVALSPGPLLADDRAVTEVLRHRRAEAEEGRHLNEDWGGDPHRPRLPLRVGNPVDLAAAVAGAGAVVASSGTLMALAWSLGVPHVAVAAEETPASDFAAWTGDASALVEGPSELLATIDNIFARRGRPPGLKRLEATLDQSLDQAAAELEATAGKVSTHERDGRGAAQAAEARLAELEAVNDALRQRLAAERLRFGERAALLERAAETTVESAIKAVRGQDVIVRRRLEQVEREMRRLQDETAVQQAELRAIYATRTMKMLTPARQFYGRLRKSAR